MVEAQSRLVSSLGISKLLCVAGGSMGGMQVLQWTVSFRRWYKRQYRLPLLPDIHRNRLPLTKSVDSNHGRPGLERCNYYGMPHRPSLAVARMIGHITYMSDASMAEKFGRRVKEERTGKKFSPI